MIKMVQKQFYHGTTGRKKFKIIAKESTQGICLNVYHGFSKIKSQFLYAESLNIPLFIDNGSFERFMFWRKRNDSDQPKSKRLSTEEYFSKDNAFEFFARKMEDFKMIFQTSKNPRRIIVTIPELIGKSEITHALQLKYIPQFRKLQLKYGFTPIIALQFNPLGNDFENEMKECARFIAKNIPISWNWRVGIPFGNDFKIIQMGRGGGKQYSKVIHLFKTTLKGRQAHLFACGTVNKIQLHGAYEFVKSCDASTLGYLSYNGHYISHITAKVVDPRALRHWIEEKKKVYKNGKIEIKPAHFHCSLKNSEKKRQILADEGWNWKEWLRIKQVTNKYKNDPLMPNQSTNEFFRFKLLLTNFKAGLLHYFARSPQIKKTKSKTKTK